ncbi:hypothetical protein B5M09_002707 [Aphanomyces astaci]|uniref:3-methyl-2-oxobutanoate hydroxymethyltransferase n=1 Tax=Aphanomyces astaci TaxID=112090 RepID=A0A425CRY3_APHAT|nr:hypothetical protein B5M09_002707 [Aphanomyces astaci]
MLTLLVTTHILNRPMFHRRLLSSSSQLATVAKSFSDVPRFDPVAQRTLKLLERKKVTTLDVGILKAKNKPITMVTAYDYPSAVHVDLAGFDILLVGDSVGMVELGMDTGASRPLIVGDMPFGTCEGDPYEALKNAQRLMKARFCDAVLVLSERCRKAEWTASRLKAASNGQIPVRDLSVSQFRLMQSVVRMLVQGGIAVMGHVGLRPQAISVLGGFRAQGRTAKQADQIIQDALAVQHVPKFCKKYADVGERIRQGLEDFREDVENQRFPSEEYAPYKVIMNIYATTLEVQF